MKFSSQRRSAKKSAKRAPRHPQLFGLAIARTIANAKQLTHTTSTSASVKNDPNVTVADFLEDQRKKDGAVKIYCDDGAIRVLSGIPLEEFRNQYNSPFDEKAFIQSLRDHHIRFVVYKDLPGSPLRKTIRDLRSRTTHNDITLEEVVPTSRKPTKDVVVVYRVHESELANDRLRFTTRTKFQRQ